MTLYSNPVDILSINLEFGGGTSAISYSHLLEFVIHHSISYLTSNVLTDHFLLIPASLFAVAFSLLSLCDYCGIDLKSLISLAILGRGRTPSVFGAVNWVISSLAATTSNKPSY